MNTQKKHTIAIVIAIIAVVVILVTGILLISYWNTPIAKAESRTMQAIALQEDGSAELCTVLISGISYHYLFRNHADSFEATEPGGVFVNGSRIMDSLILPSDIDSDWMFWQDNMLWCDAAGEQLIVLLHRDADGAFAETGTPVLVIAPAETEQKPPYMEWGAPTKPGSWSPFYRKPRNLYNTGQAVCGSRGCTRACMISLETRGVLQNSFRQKFRRRPQWSVDWSTPPEYAAGTVFRPDRTGSSDVD